MRTLIATAKIGPMFSGRLSSAAGGVNIPTIGEASIAYECGHVTDYWRFAPNPGFNPERVWPNNQATICDECIVERARQEREATKPGQRHAAYLSAVRKDTGY